MVTPTTSKNAPAAGPARPSAHHIKALDGLRGLAILMVMVHHFTTIDPADPAGPAFRAVARSGWVGVDLFFVLSGFLITGLLCDAKGSPSYFRSFYARRVLRIFPLYYGFLALRFLIAPALYHPSWTDLRVPASTQGWAWTYLTNVQIAVAQSWQAPAEFTAHLWSLGVEEQFYLVWPLVVLVASLPQLVAACLVLIPMAGLWRTGVRVFGDNVDAAYVMLPSHLDALAAGALVAVLVRVPRGLGPVIRYRRPIAVAASLVLAAIFAQHGGLILRERPMQTVGYTCLAVLFALLVASLASSHRGRAVRLFEHPFLRFYGRYSYAIYVFHLPLVPLVTRYYSLDRAPAVLGTKLPAQLLFIIVASAVSTLAAVASWHAYEKHFLKLKRFFPYHEPAAARRAAA